MAVKRKTNVLILIGFFLGIGVLSIGVSQIGDPAQADAITIRSFLTGVTSVFIGLVITLVWILKKVFKLFKR